MDRREHSSTAAWAAWAVLTITTLASWGLGADHGALLSDRKLTGALVLTLAFFKIFLVGLYFMELRFAPRSLQHPFNFWTLSTALLVISLYVVL